LSGYWVSVRVPRGLLISVGIIAMIALEVNQQLDAGPLTQP
jgi:hypothetical protein